MPETVLGKMIGASSMIVARHGKWSGSGRLTLVSLVFNRRAKEANSDYVNEHRYSVRATLWLLYLVANTLRFANPLGLYRHLLSSTSSRAIASFTQNRSHPKR